MLPVTRRHSSFLTRSLLTLGLLVGMFTVVVTPAAASAPAPNPETAQYEVDFMQQMIDHHTMAAVMGTVCLPRAVHDELRQTCTDIITSQGREIVTMESWLVRWYSQFSVPSLTSGEIHQVAQLASLRGGEFEMAFMQQMSMHHEMAIEMAQTCVAQAYHGDLVNLCQNVITAQQDEIQQMQTWLCDWYGICKQD